MMTVVIYPHFQWQWECQSKLELTDWLTQKLCWCRPLLSALPWERQKDEWEVREGNKEVLLLVKIIHIFLPKLNFILQLLQGATMWLPPPTSSSSWPSSRCWRGSATTSSTWKPVTRWVLESSSSPPPRQSSPSPSWTAQPASSQVTVMQNELTALRPQLLETSDETEKLMIKIEQDTIQAGWWWSRWNWVLVLEDAISTIFFNRCSWF